MRLTQIIGQLFVARQRELERYHHEAEQLQRESLRRLLHMARFTEYGRNHLF